MASPRKDEIYILTHDLGTSGDKAVLVDSEGNLVASEFRPYPTYRPRPLWVEQCPEDWWVAVVESTRNILRKTKIPPEKIAAISFSGHFPGCVPVDKEGRVVRKYVMIWADLRAEEQGKKLVEKLGGYENFYKIHGLGHPLGMLSISKVMWLKENEPEVYNRTYKFLQTWDYIILKLTGKFVGDYGGASNTGWLDVRKRKYSEEILEAAGIDMDKLPDLYESHDVVGYVTDEAAKVTGLKPGTPVVAGSGDSICAAVGAGVVKERTAYCYIGTASQLAAFSHEPILDPKARINNFLSAIPGKYTPFSYISAGGLSVDWFKSTFLGIEESILSNLGIKVLDVYESKAREVKPGCGGLIFIPYIAGGGGPHWNPNARGAFIGITSLHTKRADFYRAVLEGVAFAFKWLVEQFEEAGIPLRKWGEFRTIGGGALSDLWVQIHADILNMKMIVLENPQDTTAIGAAIMGGIGVGLWKSYEEAAERVVKIKKVVEPTPENVEIYEKLYELFKSSFRNLNEIFNKLSTI